MKIAEIEKDITPRLLRQFAAACLVFLCGFGITSLLKNPRSTAGGLLLGLGASIGVAGLVWPISVRLLYLAAALVTMPIGAAVSQLLMAVIYYGLLTPVRILFSLTGRDRLRLARTNIARPSHWQPRPPPPPLESYFQQF